MRICLALLSLAACGGADLPTARAAAPAAAAPTTASAGDLITAVAPDRDAVTIAALRAEGPAALARLLADYDKLPAGVAKQRLAATIDKVAGQRFATVSRLYWYTDLPAAEAEAHRTGKPILSLRMLGRLDEDLSCANSRFFRTVLYANAQLAPWLRDHFVLHWSSERAVPKITIDFGDGRVLERTVTGNSAHFVLDADGHPLDVLPGLYAPSAFQAELTKSLALAQQVAGKSAAERHEILIGYHADHSHDRRAQAAQLGAVPVIYRRRGLLGQADVDDALALAQRATMTKAYVEVPDLRIVDVGADPGALAPDLELWSVIGQRVYGWGAPELPTPAVEDGLTVIDRHTHATRRPAPHPSAPPLHLLDAQSIALVLALADAPGAPPLSKPEQDAMLARLDQTLAADSAQNELVLRPQIDEYFADTFTHRGEATFDGLDAYLYANVFHTPASDPWLGLLPRDAFTGLPADGVVTRR
jgi:hypothetical protein